MPPASTPNLQTPARQGERQNMYCNREQFQDNARHESTSSFVGFVTSLFKHHLLCQLTSCCSCLIWLYSVCFACLESICTWVQPIDHSTKQVGITCIHDCCFVFHDCLSWLCYVITKTRQLLEGCGVKRCGHRQQLQVVIWLKCWESVGCTVAASEGDVTGGTHRANAAQSNRILTKLNSHNAVGLDHYE